MIDLIDVLPEPERPINKTFFVIGDAISTSPRLFTVAGFLFDTTGSPGYGRRRAYGSVPPSYVFVNLVWTVLANFADSARVTVG